MVVSWADDLTQVGRPVDGWEEETRKGWDLTFTAGLLQVCVCVCVCVYLCIQD